MQNYQAALSYSHYSEYLLAAFIEYWTAVSFPALHLAKFL